MGCQDIVIELKHEGLLSGIYLSFTKDAVISTASNFSDSTRRVLSLSVELDFSKCKVECPSFEDRERVPEFKTQFSAQEIGSMSAEKGNTRTT